MTSILGTAGLAAALVAAAVMGFAIQRGATCTVVAVAEVVHYRRWTRFGALLEASLWVAGCLVLAKAAGVAMIIPQDFALTAATIAGGVLLGLGAVINGACMVGTIARLGSGEWRYAATPVGFFVGCIVVVEAGLMPSPAALGGRSPVLDAPLWLALTFIAFAAIRGTQLAFARAPVHRWSPHAATVVIALMFVVMLLLAGPWAYTDVLAEAALGMTANSGVRLLLFAALLAGAVCGGWSAGVLAHRPPQAVDVARCLIGGMVMAMGSLLIPGSNDGLILVGLPVLHLYAWAAFATMIATVAVALSPWGFERRRE